MALASADAWTVVPVFTKPRKKASQKARAAFEPVLSHYELRFGGDVQDKEKGEHGARRLRDIAAFLNVRKWAPRPRIECAADAPNPEAYLKKITP